MLRSYARFTLPFVAGLFVACVVVQVFLAGLGVFNGPGNFITHRDFGYTFSFLVLILVVLALIARAGRRIVGLSLLLGLQFILQSVFVAVRADMPQVAALHPVNGFLILVVGIALTREAWGVRHATTIAPTTATAPASSAEVTVS